MTNSTLMWNSTATSRATFSSTSCSCWIPVRHKRERVRHPEANNSQFQALLPSPQMLTDVVNGSGTEFAIELFGAEASQVMNGVGPEVQHVVPGERVPLLDHHHLGTHQGELDGGAQATGASTDDEALKRQGEISSTWRNKPLYEKDKNLLTRLYSMRTLEISKESNTLLLLGLNWTTSRQTEHGGGG